MKKGTVNSVSHDITENISGNKRGAYQFQIEPATLDDIPSVQHIARITWRNTYSGVIDETAQERVLSRAYSAESLGESIRLHQAFLVARISPAAKDRSIEPPLSAKEKIGRLLAGYVDMDLLGQNLYLYRLYILPEYQHLGLGRQLFQSALRKALSSLSNDSKEQVRVIAQVEKDNQNARAFYRKLGFVEGREEMVEIGGVSLPIVEVILH